MHVMVATDGSVDPKKAAAIASCLAGDDQITIYTVIEVPRDMLDDMRAAAGGEADHKTQEVTVEHRRTQAGDPPVTPWVGDDAVVASYVKRRVKAQTAELVTELEAVGADFTVVGEEGENAARSVLQTAKSNGADVLCIGTHGLGRFEGLLGSLSTKVARLAPCSVVLIR